MANAIKFQSEFRDLVGDQWRINIHDETFGGTTPTTFTLGAAGFQISYKGDTENVFQSVIGSSVTFEFIEETAAHTAFFDALATATESRFTVSIEKWDGANYHLWWFGVLLSDQWERMHEPLPRSSSLTASDDIGNLTAIEYKSDPDTPYQGNATLVEHLSNCLTKTRALHLFDTADVLIRIADDFRAENTSVANRFLENTRVNHETFWNVTNDGEREFMSAFDVLKNICQSQNARLFLSDGIFHFVPIGAYQDDTTITFHDYDTTGDFVASTSAINTTIPVGNELVELAGNMTRFTPPLWSAKRIQKFNGNAPVLFVPTIAQNEFGIAQTDFGADYLTDTKFNVAGSVNVVIPDVANVASADERVGRIAIVMTLKCGNLYARRPLEFTFGNGVYQFNDGTTGEFGLELFGGISWTASAATIVFVSSPFDRLTGGGKNIPLTITTAALPSDQSGLEMTLVAKFIESDGSLVAINDGFDVGDYPTYYGAGIVVVRADENGGGDEITFTAYGDESNRAIKIDDTVVLGDRIGASDRGVLQVWNGTDWVDSTGWNSANYTDAAVGINRLAVAEIVRTMRSPIQLVSGSFHLPTTAQLISMATTIEFESETYLLTELAIGMNDRISNFEMARIVRSNDAIEELTSGKKNVSPFVIPNDEVSPTTAIAPFVAVVNDNNNDIGDLTDGVNANSASIGALTTSLNTTQTKLEYFIGTFQPVDEPGNDVTKIVYANSKVDGLEMILTQTTAAFQSNSGNTSVTIQEQSPGIFRVDLQDDTTNSVLAIFATANLNLPLVGIGTDIPKSALDVVGDITASDSVSADAFFVGETLTFSDSQELIPTNGQMTFNGDRFAFSVGIGTTAVDIESDWWLCRNATGATIAKGVPVYVNGTLGASGRKTIAPMVADGTINARLFIGVTAAAVANGADVVVLDRGTIRGINTNAFTAGDVLWVSQTTAGTFTATEPTSGQKIAAGFVIHEATNGVMAVRNLGAEIEATGGGGNAFETIAVNGQSSIVADASDDTLTIAAGTNVAITTDAPNDTLTIGLIATPTFDGLTIGTTGILTTGSISAFGTITAIGTISANGSFSVQGSSSFLGSATFSQPLIASGIEFIGGGTSVIQPTTVGVNLPDDLEIRSNGNVVIVLDYDDDEVGQSFEVRNGDGTTIFKVDESGITTGLLTTATPTITGLADQYQQGGSAIATISNHVTGRTYVGIIYNASGTEQTSNPVTIDSNGNVSFNVPSTIADNYELRIVGVDAGKFRSIEIVETFNVVASRTFTHWRFEIRHNGGDPGSNYLMAYNIDLFEGADASGTKHPSAALTSATSLSGLVVTWGYSYPNREFWKCFDSNETGSDWWTISSPTGTDWGQLAFDTAITIQSIRLSYSDQFTNANQLVVLGSNTGDFNGEEIECGTFDLTDGTIGTITLTLNI